jgi:hypothetical protein
MGNSSLIEWIVMQVVKQNTFFETGQKTSKGAGQFFLPLFLCKLDPISVFIPIFLLTAFCSSPSSAVYYVDKTNIHASDGNRGGIALQPLRSIQTAMNRAKPGDSILVASGSYDERTATIRDATMKWPITCIARGLVITKGFIVKNSFIRIIGFQIQGNVAAAYDGAIQISKSASNCEILNCIICDLSKDIYGISFEKGGNEPSLSAQSCIIESTLIRNIKFHAVSFFGSNHLFQNNTIDNTNGFDAIRLAGNGIIIRHNRFLHITETGPNHADIIQSFGENGDVAFAILFEGNIVSDCDVCQICNLSQDGIAGIRDWTFRNNIFDRIGAAANVAIPNVKWYNNLFYKCVHNYGHVIAITSGPTGRGNDCSIVNNIFYECGSAPEVATYGWYSTYAYQGYPPVTGFSADYNFVCGTAFSKKNTQPDASFIFSEENGINGGNPGFKGKGDFSPCPTSVLVGKGKNLTSCGFNEDYKGDRRQEINSWDIGPLKVQ